MALKDIIMLTSQVSVGAIVTFFAILLWSHTREIEWMLVIMGALLKYVEILIHTLILLGVIQGDIYIIPRYVDVELLLKILPQLFYGAAFIVKLAKIVRGME